MRKSGKLSGAKIGREFDLEYGRDRIEMHVGAVDPDQRVLVIDHLLATRGTAQTAIELRRDVGAVVEECAFVVALPDLGGIARLEKRGCHVRCLCEFSRE